MPINYRDYNPYIIEMLDRQTKRRRDESRYNTDDTTKTIREVYGNIAKGIQSGLDNYAKFSDLSHKNAKSEEDIRQARAKTKAIEAEEALLSETDPDTGRTRREQIYKNKYGYEGQEKDYLHAPLAQGGTRWQQDYETDRQAKLLDMDQRRALLEKHLGEKDYQDKMLHLRQLELQSNIVDRAADNRRLDRQLYSDEKAKLLENMGAIYARAKNNPEEIAKADQLARKHGLSDLDIEVAKGIGKTKSKSSPAQEAMDKESGKMISEWVHRGDAQMIRADIEKLKTVENMLLNRKNNVSGSIIGRLPLQDVFNPAGKDAADAVASVTQKNLKEILGGQFAAREGEELIKRAYDPTMDEAYNYQRVKALREAMEKQADAKDRAANFLERYGTLEGLQEEFQRAEQTGAPEVRRITQDGRIAVFDAKTKKFLRYEKQNGR